MNYDFWLRFAALLFTAITSLIPALFGLFQVRRSQLREDFKFALLFFKEIETSPDMHSFLREKGLQAIAGDSKLSTAEVEYVLNKLRNPVRSLNDYVFGRS